LDKDYFYIYVINMKYVLILLKIDFFFKNG